MAQQQKNFDSTKIEKETLRAFCANLRALKRQNWAFFVALKLHTTQGGEVQPDGLGQGGDVFSEINHLDPSPGAG